MHKIIEALAFRLYLGRGGENAPKDSGDALSDWLLAESEIKRAVAEGADSVTVMTQQAQPMTIDLSGVESA